MRLAILYPHYDHPAIEERYGSWQAQLFLRRAAPGAEWVTYGPAESVGAVAGAVTADHCLVVTDPLLLVGDSLVAALTAALSEDVVAAIPTTNSSTETAQLVKGLEPYLTIRQFQEAAAARAAGNTPPSHLTWSGNPGLYLASAAHLREIPGRAAEALDGRTVAIAPDAYVHRWTELRSQPRTDLLPRIPAAAHSILEFGCAEGLIGATVKARQACRYVGIEIDPEAAARAEARLDHVYRGDATELVTTLDERFDCIIGGDVLEHLADPWSFLIHLREIAAADGVLLLSIPNVANWAIVDDLLRGRFDYAYIAIACAGHLRFFSRNTIADALEIAGWSVASIEPQEAIVNRDTETLFRRLEAAGIPHDRQELLAQGFYVTARNTASVSR
jgi:2-polyprenyl-3-methyl-5-hydroxy-6-metoxy-1,4-benzoquinol methylase